MAKGKVDYGLRRQHEEGIISARRRKPKRQYSGAGKEMGRISWKDPGRSDGRLRGNRGAGDDMLENVADRREQNPPRVAYFSQTLACDLMEEKEARGGDIGCPT